jgi:mono/diheme cytochrome c family protein
MSCRTEAGVERNTARAISTCVPRAATATRRLNRVLGVYVSTGWALWYPYTSKKWNRGLDLVFLGVPIAYNASMQKLFLNVAAFILSAALVILAQAPDSAAPAGKAPAGPDAVAANIVNTVCASCHTLDRVKNKMGDSDAWTATVTRMQGKGADLTDAQVPLVVEYLTRAASTLTIAAPDGKGGRGGGRGGKGGGKVAPFSAGGAGIVSASNLKVLTAQNVEITMQNITLALGVDCYFCHDVNDLSLDTKPKKLKARMMLEMVRDINAKFGDGKTHVTCWTCHRASTEPQIAKASTN